jgi:hypothetical protein
MAKIKSQAFQSATAPRVAANNNITRSSRLSASVRPQNILFDEIALSPPTPGKYRGTRYC